MKMVSIKDLRIVLKFIFKRAFYMLNETNMLIQILDIDECAMASTNDCSANAYCENTLGYFTCTCKSGFAGDGRNCTGITRS